jgi:hypothetical protein
LRQGSSIVPPVALLGAERHRFCVAGPQQRAAARLDHRHRQGAVTQVSVPAAAVAVERAFAEAHQVQHHHGGGLIELAQSFDVQQVDGHSVSFSFANHRIIHHRGTN